MMKKRNNLMLKDASTGIRTNKYLLDTYRNMMRHNKKSIAENHELLFISTILQFKSKEFESGFEDTKLMKTTRLVLALVMNGHGWTYEDAFDYAVSEEGEKLIDICDQLSETVKTKFYDNINTVVSNVIPEEEK
ncbi:hypothetical protein KMW28_21095 [Flammeovirga yaeyamensis]|uniref:Uncharacterized protein n=1 Tax=Flammeovirga yaeyamensis TaxID=367791 RepID=A0AAX1NCI1_9BACT|nr:hypothetical protein [Flammeovirga yaeyamensis]MBB3697154.1 hypothetical protein [Flammeovirga yaeyamensis]NMF33814.1 hypothetical protein [Flammeovirga yaeyamensis]QWG04922.1 hypothetical protein KMW28_21095 [Flammeovirga yaeyamensis]